MSFIDITTPLFATLTKFSPLLPLLASHTPCPLMHQRSISNGWTMHYSCMSGSSPNNKFARCNIHKLRNLWLWVWQMKAPPFPQLLLSFYLYCLCLNLILPALTQDCTEPLWLRETRDKQMKKENSHATLTPPLPPRAAPDDLLLQLTLRPLWTLPDCVGKVDWTERISCEVLSRKRQGDVRQQGVRRYDTKSSRTQAEIRWRPGKVLPQKLEKSPRK